MTNTITATKKDFKIGAILTTKIGGWEFRIIAKGNSGLWETEQKMVDEGEAHIYNVKK